MIRPAIIQTDGFPIHKLCFWDDWNINIIVNNENVDHGVEGVGGDADLFFGPDTNTETNHIQYVDPTTDMYDILVDNLFFPSKSQARKNWTRTGQQIPYGWTELHKVGKYICYAPRNIYIWNPEHSRSYYE